MFSAVMPERASLMQLVGRLADHLDRGTLRAGFMEPIKRGSASGFVLVIPTEDRSGDLILMVRLEIMKLAAEADREALYRRLLELNHGFLGRAAFSVDPDGTVHLTAGRPVEDLDPSEIVDVILWTSEQADHHDDALVEEFGDARVTS